MTSRTPAPQREAAPRRTAQHDALEVFLGDWAAEGDSYGGPQQQASDPRGHPAPWRSTHSGRWHTGQFFLIQDERAMIGSDPFDTLSVLGVDPDTGRCFARSFENHGFTRHYDLDVDGDLDADGQVWTLSGPTERARIEFSGDGRQQTIAWEWCPHGQWLPLCDRVARRQD